MLTGTLYRLIQNFMSALASVFRVHADCLEDFETKGCNYTLQQSIFDRYYSQDKFPHLILINPGRTELHFLLACFQEVWIPISNPWSVCEMEHCNLIKVVT